MPEAEPTHTWQVTFTDGQQLTFGDSYFTTEDGLVWFKNRAGQAVHGIPPAAILAITRAPEVQPNQVVINISGSVLSEAELLRTVEKQMAGLGRRTAATYQSYKRR
jgi:hypothetical protein